MKDHKEKIVQLIYRLPGGTILLIKAHFRHNIVYTIYEHKKYKNALILNKWYIKTTAKCQLTLYSISNLIPVSCIIMCICFKTPTQMGVLYTRSGRCLSYTCTGVNYHPRPVIIPPKLLTSVSWFNGTEISLDIWSPAEAHSYPRFIAVTHRYGHRRIKNALKRP